MSDRTRRAPIAQPTSERTADQSTPSASGLTAGRRGVNREPDSDDDEDVVTRLDRGQAETPRRYEETEKDAGGAPAAEDPPANER